MITGSFAFFAARCHERGYTLEEVRACIVSEDGDSITVDETHAAYPRHPKHGHPPKTPEAPPPAGGPGTNLKAFFLKWFGQKATPNCSCNAVAAQMDTMGPQWCRDNMDWILEQIRLNAERRKLPFIRAVVEPIVLLAIRKAERQAKSGQ